MFHPSWQRDFGAKELCKVRQRSGVFMYYINDPENGEIWFGKNRLGHLMTQNGPASCASLNLTAKSVTVGIVQSL